jgi:hypothetical protein
MKLRSSRVVVGVGVLSLGKAMDEVEFLLGESDVLLMQLVLDGRPANTSSLAPDQASDHNQHAPSSVGILDTLQELVELVSLCRTHNLLAVDVVTDVREVVVEVGGDAADPVRRLRSPGELAHRPIRRTWNPELTSSVLLSLP